MDNNSIWVRIMREKYIKNNNFFRIPKKKRDSIVWKEVVNHIKYIQVGLKWCIGDERKSLLLDRLLGLHVTTYFYYG